MISQEYVQAVKLLQFLGASGAGKTSLLNVLACRIQNTEKVSLAGNL